MSLTIVTHQASTIQILIEIKNRRNWNPLYNVDGCGLMINNIADSEALNKTAIFLRTDQKCVEITSRFYVCSQKMQRCIVD